MFLLDFICSRYGPKKILVYMYCVFRPYSFVRVFGFASQWGSLIYLRITEETNKLCRNKIYVVFNDEELFKGLVAGCHSFCLFFIFFILFIVRYVKFSLLWRSHQPVMTNLNVVLCFQSYGVFVVAVYCQCTILLVFFAVFTKLNGKNILSQSHETVL
jgi:hypothetical protein